jgi:hypothetical protein
MIAGTARDAGAVACGAMLQRHPCGMRASGPARGDGRAAGAAHSWRRRVQVSSGGHQWKSRVRARTACASESGAILRTRTFTTPPLFSTLPSASMNDAPRTSGRCRS